MEDFTEVELRVVRAMIAAQADRELLSFKGLSIRLHEASPVMTAGQAKRAALGLGKRLRRSIADPEDRRFAVRLAGTYAGTSDPIKIDAGKIAYRHPQAAE